jgi:hypothetical protein
MKHFTSWKKTYSTYDFYNDWHWREVKVFRTIVLACLLDRLSRRHEQQRNLQRGRPGGDKHRWSRCCDDE